MILKLFNLINKIPEKRLFTILLILNSLCVVVDIFVVKDYLYLVLNVIAIWYCIDTLIRIKRK